jgi:hypothetical protein
MALSYVVIPGRINRIINAVVPAALARGMRARKFTKRAAATTTPQS